MMDNFGGFGKFLVAFGVFLVITGLVVTLFGKYINLGRLPGDIVVKRGNFTYFFPVATSIILSIVLSLILNLLVRK